MRYTAASVLAFASAVLAQTAGFDPILKPTKDEAVPAGKTYTVVWTPSTEYNGTISLTLLGGATPSTLQVLSVLQSGVENSLGQYEWAVASSLGSLATYGIEITLDSNPSTLQFSFPFQITGGSTATGTATATETGKTTANATTATTTTSSSSSSTKATTITTITSSSRSSNLTTTKTTGTGTTHAVTTSTQTAVKTGSSPTTTGSTVTTNDAKSLGGAASLVSLIGGLAVAFFAL